MNQKLVIGVSKLEPNYEQWLRKLHNHITIINLYELPADEVTQQVNTVAGILLPGGGDIHPGLYQCHDDIALCKSIDPKRDDLETGIIKQAFRFGIPVLGICRGLQILNVAMGGSLYADIPTSFEEAVPHKGENDVFHTVRISEDSLLHNITGIVEGQVNSSHHQAICRLAPVFRASALSGDGVTEAIEVPGANRHPFCLAVQWHPERMDILNPLSGQLGKTFLDKAEMRRKK
jgi:putative glutamine amidotransferase